MMSMVESDFLMKLILSGCDSQTRNNCGGGEIIAAATFRGFEAHTREFT